MLGAAVGRRMCEEVEQERVGERVSGVGCAVREEGGGEEWGVQTHKTTC